MNKIDMLKYLGVTPVLPNRTFPGAAPSDSFDGAWAFKLRKKKPASQTVINQQVQSQSDSAQAVMAAHSTLANIENTHKNDIAKSREKNASVGLTAPTPGARLENPKQQDAPQAKHLNRPLKAFQHQQTGIQCDINNQDPGTQNSNLSQSAQPVSENLASNENLEFSIAVVQHAELNILVLAELAKSSALHKQELQLLKKILLSFSANKAAGWRQKRFSWPLKTQKHIAYRQNIDAASDTFLGYLESLQKSKPKHFLCFSKALLIKLLNLDNASDLQKAEQPVTTIQQRATDTLWKDQTLVLLADINSYGQNKNAKAELWQFIKTQIIAK